MQTRPLGPSGIQASAIGFGAWAIGGWMWGGAEEQDAIRALQAAIDQGMNLIDTAPMYGFGHSEEIVGQAIQGRRERVILATKCGLVWHVEQGEFYFHTDEKHPTQDAAGAKYRVHRCLRPETIRYEVEQSLRRLRTDRIDLYQTHWQEKTTPITDTMAELLKLKAAGKIRAIGCSNATPEQMDAYRAAGTLDADQERYSMLDRKHDQANLPYCARHRLAFLAYSPLAQGLLTGAIGPARTFAEGDQRGRNPRFSVENRQKVANLLAAIRPIADRHGLTLGQLALAWTVRQPGCSHALAGARSPEQVIENAKAGDATLSPAECDEIRQAILRHAADVP